MNTSCPEAEPRVSCDPEVVCVDDGTMLGPEDGCLGVSVLQPVTSGQKLWGEG